MQINANPFSILTEAATNPNQSTPNSIVEWYILSPFPHANRPLFPEFSMVFQWFSQFLPKVRSFCAQQHARATASYFDLEGENTPRCTATCGKMLLQTLGKAGHVMILR